MFPCFSFMHERGRQEKSGGGMKAKQRKRDVEEDEAEKESKIKESR